MAQNNEAHVGGTSGPDNPLRVELALMAQNNEAPHRANGHSLQL